MEKIKLATIGEFKDGSINLYESECNGSLVAFLTNLPQVRDGDHVVYKINVLIGEGFLERKVALDVDFPFIRKWSAKPFEIINVTNAILELCPETKFDRDFDSSKYGGRLWFFKGKLVWASRETTSKDDHELVALKVQERVLKDSEELLSLVSRVHRLLSLADEESKEFRRFKIDDTVLAFVLKRDGEQCVNCGCTENLQFDHILPVSRGGNSEPENLRVLCKACNLRRGSLRNLI